MVRDSSDTILPGVTVTVTSLALLGSRTAVTDRNGNYEILGLPNGSYAVTFALESFTTVEQTLEVPLGGTIEADATMHLGAVSESVEVTAVVPPPLASTETSQNITSDAIGQLPMGRTPFRIAELAPGLTANTPNDGQVAINGSFAYDNIYLVDGVDVNDSLFGDADNLFIEDAVAEVQVLTSGISAEYGRFSGGVINVVTKSGGNRFSGSFRTNLYKPDWTRRTPFEIENDNDRTGDIADNATYETTLGGPVLKDRVWFFFANRRERRSADATLPESGIAYIDSNENDRNQIKFTGSVAPGHTLAGTYLRNSTVSAGPTFPFGRDPATLINPTIPNDLWVATYRGAVNSRLFIEGQVSRKEWGRRNVGGTSTNIFDSPFITITQGLGQYGAPFFDASDPEDRNNRQFTGSATYYLPTNVGTHSIKSGFEHFRSTRTGGNSQSSTGFYFITPYAENPDGSPQLDGNGRFIPVFGDPAPLTLLLTTLPERGARIDTVSFYVNDNWAVNDNISINLGLRGEKVTSDATGGIAGLDTVAVVPRLAVAFDPGGDGRYTFQATYSQYAGKYSDAQFAANTNVGTPDELTAVYIGPPGQGVDFAPGFDTANYFTVAGDFPVQNVFFDDNLKSPRTKELTVSAGAAIGDHGYAKLTYINRRASDFVEDFVTLDGGSTLVTGEDGEAFGTFSNITYRNTDALERNYDGLEFQGRYQAASNVLVDGSYTVQNQERGKLRRRVTQHAGNLVILISLPRNHAGEQVLPDGPARRLSAAQDPPVGHLQPRHRRCRPGRYRGHLALQLRTRLQHQHGPATDPGTGRDPGGAWIRRWARRTDGVLRGPRDEDIRRVRPVRPVGQLRDSGLELAQPVDQVRPVQRVQQRQADSVEHRRQRRPEQPGGRVRHPDRLHRRTAIRRGDIRGPFPAVHRQRKWSADLPDVARLQILV